VQGIADRYHEEQRMRLGQSDQGIQQGQLSSAYKDVAPEAVRYPKSHVALDAPAQNKQAQSKQLRTLHLKKLLFMIMILYSFCTSDCRGSCGHAARGAAAMDASDTFVQATTVEQSLKGLMY
jgi:hypothetical protein